MDIASGDASRPSIAVGANRTGRLVDAPTAPFADTSSLYRVVFGSGISSRLREEAEPVGIRRTLASTTPEQHEASDRPGAHLGDHLAGAFAGARMSGHATPPPSR